MLLYSSNCSYYNVVVLFGFFLLSRTRDGKCNPITNSNLNEDIREFATKEDDINSTNVKTLQKENPRRYTDIASFKPIIFEWCFAVISLSRRETSRCAHDKPAGATQVRNVFNIDSSVDGKDVPDSKQSSSSYGRGLVSREHPGFGLHDYEEYPHVNYGYDYHLPESHHHGYDHHDFSPHYGHYGGHYVGHHKYYNHALAAKAVLWPIAGIALLGAAAALVSNPILLQLGVASGKRRRRNTEEITGPELSTEITEWRPLIKRNVAAIKTGSHLKSTETKLLHRKAQLNDFSTTQRIMPKRNPTTESHVEDVHSPLDEVSDEINFVPIPIKTNYE